MILKNWLQYRRKQQMFDIPSHGDVLDTNNQGLTLIECLVAIAVIGISMAVTAPMIVLSVATRTQSQRADQALQIAQAEVDRIRFTVINNDTYAVSAATVAVNSVGNFVAVAAPEDINNAAYSTTSAAAKGIDVDGDGNPDYAAQIFKTVGSTVGTTPVAFDLGVRIYDADAVNTKTSAQLDVDQARIGLTSGEGQRGTKPLSVIYTSVIKSDTSRSLCDYHNFIDSVQGTTTSSPSQC
ncbi:type II secretion system protein [Leptothoe kymatousa]|uniref:Type II secretion system protein n=1 Tax=Leptothoe kymatousa TAU-MAC 1615 TaxID=2364775 RepID=A0ABS5Y119_9CYAN|nr:type II secretion system protein [Leptothoe kymatousa]MBT9311513.1 type II secretion system protein [Leptothoe kymatousa TAU-MAC 1615]